MQPADAEREVTGAGEARQLPVCVGILMCERVIKDAEDGTFSFIRYVDTVNLPAESPDGRREAFELDDARVVVMLKSGGATGSFDVVMLCKPPGGEAVPIGVVAAEFSGAPELGTNVIGSMKFPLAGAGVYWLSVQIEGQVVGKTPFRVNILPISAGTGEAGTAAARNAAPR